MKKEYRKYGFKLSVDAHSFIRKLLNDVSLDDYFVYEDKDKWYIGLGVEHEILINSDGELYSGVPGDLTLVPYENLSEGIEQSIQLIDINGAVLFGTADFELTYLIRDIKKSKNAIYDKIFRVVVPSIYIKLDSNISVNIIDSCSFEKSQDYLDKIERIACFSFSDGKTDCLSGNIQKVTNDQLFNNESEYKRAVSDAVKAISDGEFDKVIVSRRVTLPNPADIVKTFFLGRPHNNPARSFILSRENYAAAGYSPELVAKITKDNKVITQPLAGTRALGKTEQETNSLRAELMSDPKELAEHAMSVRLSIDELKSVCDESSVVVDNYMNVVERGSVQHIASSVVGTLKPNLNQWDAFLKLFPAVTASGIDKYKSSEFIQKIEPVTRELYSGSVFMVQEDGGLDAALVLRSIYSDGENTWIQAGAGVVKNSNPEREFEETCEKLQSVSNYIVYQ